jgi:hypothetical protein
MSKVIYVKKTSFEVIQEIIKRQFRRVFDSSSDDVQKVVLFGADVKSVDELLSREPRSYCPYVRRSEKLRIIPYISLGHITLDVCSYMNSYYVPGYVIPKNLQVIALQVDTPFFMNWRGSREVLKRFLIEVSNSVLKELNDL